MPDFSSSWRNVPCTIAAAIPGLSEFFGLLNAVRVAVLSESDQMPRSEFAYAAYVEAKPL